MAAAAPGCVSAGIGLHRLTEFVQQHQPHCLVSSRAARCSDSVLSITSTQSWRPYAAQGYSNDISC